MSEFNDPFASSSNQYQGLSSSGGSQYVGTASVASGPPKSKITAGLLGLFLGALGIHNFYLGFNGKAIAQLLITVLTIGYGAIITGPWALIEAILILAGRANKDARNVLLT